MPVPRGTPYRAVPQRADRVSLGIKLARCGRRLWRMQQVAILGSEQKDQPVDEAQHLSEELRQRQGAGAQLVAQRAIAGI